MPEIKDQTFSEKLIQWQLKEGRHDLPWMSTRDPYHRWIAEIMLQQTQVQTVIPYYEAFLQRFPTLEDLASSSEEEVLKVWSGLGYYSRARNLFHCAQTIMENFDGKFPMDTKVLSTLKGIGTSTAGAIVSACTGEPHLVLDANVKRVMARLGNITATSGTSEFNKAVKELAIQFLPQEQGDVYSQALMDLGATLCSKNPHCLFCPVSEFCEALKYGHPESLPIREERTEKPLVRMAFALAVQNGKVLLERRPTHSFWGGLWSLPEIGGSRWSEKPIRTIKHSFTHFTLEMTIIRRQPEQVPLVGSWRWFGKKDILKGALPAPVKKLLSEYSAIR